MPLDVVDKAALSRARAALDLLDPPSRIGLSKREISDFSIGRLLRSMTLEGRSYVDAAGLELECSREISERIGKPDLSSKFLPCEVLERAMSSIPGSKGGFLVGSSPQSFVDVLRARSVCYKLGARPLSGLTGSVPVPRIVTGAAVTWQTGDGASVTAGDQALGQLSATPKTAIAITDASEQLLRQTAPAAEALIAHDLAAAVAIGVDKAALVGAGGNEPLGIKNTTGVVSNQDAASATLTKLLAFVSAVGGANGLLDSPGWVCNSASAVALSLKQNFTGSSLALWGGSPSDGTLTGYRSMSSEQLANGNLIFGSWDALTICDWGVLELSTSRGGTRFNAAQVGIRALWMVDVLVRYPQAFVASVNLS